MRDFKLTPPSLLWPTIIVAALGFYGYLATRPALQSKRPTTAGPKQLGIPQDTQAIRSSPARMWQDPLGPGYITQYSVPLQGESAQASLLTRFFLPDKTEDGTAGPGQLSARDEVLLMPVFLSGVSTADAQETRRRTRYAIISALTTHGYRAASSREINYFDLPLPKDFPNERLVVPFEVFYPDLSDRFYDPDDYVSVTNVLLCWMDEEKLADRLLGGLYQLLEWCVPHDAGWKICAIGPSSSDGLIDMAKEHREGDDSVRCKLAEFTESRFAEYSRRHFREYARAQLQNTPRKTSTGLRPDVLDEFAAGIWNEFQSVKVSSSESSEKADVALVNNFAQMAFAKYDELETAEPITLYSHRATVDIGSLKRRAEELKEDYSIVEAANDFLAPLWTGPTQPINVPLRTPFGLAPSRWSTVVAATVSNDTWKTLSAPILRVVRTVGTDRHLVKALTHELRLRDRFPQPINWPREHDRHETIVLITERDSLYGRAIPNLIAAELRQQLQWTFSSEATESSEAKLIRFKIVHPERNKWLRAWLPPPAEVVIECRAIGEKMFGRLLVNAETDTIKGDRLEVKREREPKEWAHIVGTWELSIGDGKNEYRAKFRVSHDEENEPPLTGRWELPSPMVVYKYIRGLDGSPTERASASQSAPVEKSDKQLSDRASGHQPTGTSQFDYLRRMECELAELDRRQRRLGGRGILAIGVVGTDVYDELLILRALAKQFPHACYFTTDLDANFSRPSELPYTRNLIVASHFGLGLHPSLQRDLPPFRESYQTTAFFSALMAMEDRRVQNVLRGTAPEELWSDTELTGDKDALQPLMFEISNHGPYQLTQTSDENLTLPAAGLGPRGPQDSLSELIHTSSRRECGISASVNVWMVLTLFVILVVFLALNLTVVGRSLRVVITAVWQVGIWTLSLVVVCVLGPAILLVIHLYRRLRRPAPAMDWFNKCGSVIRKGPGLLHTLTVLSMSVVLAVVLIMVLDHRRPSGEPLVFAGGISVWPSTLIRLGALVLSVVSIWWGIVGLGRSDQDLRSQLGLLHEPTAVDTTEPRRWGWLSWRRWQRGWKIWGLAKTALAAWQSIHVYDWQVPENGIRRLVTHYLHKGQSKYRVFRSLAMAFLFLGFALILFHLTDDWPNTPHRGNLSQATSSAVLFLAVVSMFALVFFVVDATHLCHRFVKAFRQRTFVWPRAVVENEAKRRGYLAYWKGVPLELAAAADDLHELLAIRLIARRTNDVGKLLYFPCTVLLLMALSRFNILDRWNLPLPLAVILILMFLALILHSLVLRREASETRREILVRLRERLSHVAPGSNKQDNERRDRLKLVIEAIEKEDGGAFRRITDDYLFRAFAIPFGGTGGLLLLQQLIN